MQPNTASPPTNAGHAGKAVAVCVPTAAGSHHEALGPPTPWDAPKPPQDPVPCTLQPEGCKGSDTGAAPTSTCTSPAQQADSAREATKACPPPPAPLSGLPDEMGPGFMGAQLVRGGANVHTHAYQYMCVGVCVGVHAFSKKFLVSSL